MKLKALTLTLLAVLCALPLAARTVYVARHAQVGIQIKEIKETRITEDLGIFQAQKLADFLVKKLKFNGKVYASPFYRTLETAGYTAKLLKQPVIIETGLQEMAPYQKPSPPGMTLEQIKRFFKDGVVPGARYKDNWRLCKETNSMRQVRVEKALNAILAETDGDVLLVSHGASVNDLNKIMSSRAITKQAKKIKGTAWNCALYIYELDDQNKLVNGRYTTEFMDDTELTSNYRCPKIERPNDPRYMTAAQDKADRAKRSAKLKAKEKNNSKKK